MSLKIIFTPEAEETYDALSLQLRNRWGEDYVTKFESKISKRLNQISINPYLFPVIQETTQIRRSVLHKNCSMLYRIYDEVIVVVCFWDNRQEPLISFD